MSDLQNAKTVVLDFLRELEKASPDACADLFALHCAPDMIWRGFHPFNEMMGPETVAKNFWAPLKRSLRPVQNRLDIFFAGRNEIDGSQSVWVTTMGHLMGLFDESWLGIRPTRKIAMMRYAAFYRIDEERISETAMFFDIPHLMMQAGQNPFPPQTGAHLIQPGPQTHNGLLLEEQDAAEGEKTLSAINRMITDIASWSGGRTEPLADELRRSWNEDMTWWGPAGIGSTFTVERYAEQHAGPFRTAFRNRTFNGHIARIAEGHFGGFFGWPNLTLTHQGGFMGMPATGRPGDMRVIDLYRRDGDKLSENWVFIDLLHFWNQQGVDFLARNSRLF